jgi:hypothetical protein
MQKFAITASGNYKVDVTPGRTYHLAISGTFTGTVKAQYLTAPGVFQDYATAITASAPAEKSGVNVGAHSEVNLNVVMSAGTMNIIANVECLQERGR